MPLRHTLLAVTVALIWGINFLAIDASLQQFPPFLSVALRFAVIALPTILFVRRPRVRTRWLLGYGLGFGILQFLFLYWGMAAGMPTGLASLVLQASAPFTVVLSAVFLRERLSGIQVAGILVAVAGLALVGWSRGAHAALLPFLLTLAGAFGWAIGNVCNRQAQTHEPMRFTLWMSTVVPVPMLVVSLAADGPHAIAASLTTLGTRTGLTALAGIAFTAVVATIIGSGLWSWLMARHPASAVAPFSLLVPVVGISSAWLVLGERPRPVELLGAAVIIAGVALGSVGPALWRRMRRAIAAEAAPPGGRTGITIRRARDRRHETARSRR